MAHAPTRTSDPGYRRNRAALRARRLPCAICGKPINYELRAPHPRSFSADHVDPVARGGANDGPLQAAHLGCNKRRGSKPIEKVDIRKTSRDW